MAKLGFRRVRAKAKKNGRKLALESLEERRVLATLTVNSTNDNINYDGSLTLREAIAVVNYGSVVGTIPELGRSLHSGELARINQATNAIGTSDEIEFNFSLPAQIQLSALGQLDISESVKIEGPGASLLTIKAYDADAPKNGVGSRAIEIVGSEVSTTVVGIRGVTITGGDVTGDGGGILATNASLLIEATTIRENSSKGSSASRGGGIAVIESNLELSDVEVANNESESKGGGIYALWSNVTISTGSLVVANIVEGYGGSGGGLYFDGGGSMGGDELNVSESTFRGNHAETYGGGLAFVIDLEGHGIIEESIIDSNFSGAIGGGIDVRGSGEVLISRSVVRGNRTLEIGGGIYIGAVGPAVVVDQCLVEKNRSGLKDLADLQTRGSGGGIYVELDVWRENSVLISNSTISENLASSAGGGVAAAGYTTILNSTISGNISKHGGGVSAGGDIVEIKHSTIAFNTATVFPEDMFDGIGVGEASSSGGGLWAYPIRRFTDDVFQSPFILDHSIVAMNEHIPSRWPTGHPITYSPDIGTHYGSPFGEEFELIAEYSIVGSTLGIDEVIVTTGSNFIDLSSTERANLFLDGQLSDNGGFRLPDGSTIKTLKITCDSIARDAGNSGISGEPAHDQRGEHYPRKKSTIDIGAFELGSRDFPSLAADFDDDGDVDADDLQIWKDNFGTQSLLGDADGDGDVDKNDLLIWKDEFGVGVDPNELPQADFNNDNVVDGLDFLIWQRTFGQTGVSLQGDANGDGVVDGLDFLIWQRSVGETAGCEGWADELFYLDQLQVGKIVVSTLSNTNDGYYGLGELSLIEALYIASQNSGLDEIVFADGLFGAITLDGMALSIASEVIIAGPGADKLTIDANNLSRIFDVSLGITATISGVTLTGGNQNSGGGAIYSMGSLILDAVDVIGNSTNNGGGAIFVHVGGSLRVNNSTFHDNHATDAGTSYGGAIAGHFNAGQTLTILNSTFSNNTAATGGAVKIQANGTGVATAVRIENSTFSGNSADNGGAFNIGRNTGALSDIQFLNVTIAYNTAVAGVAGGIFKTAGDIDVTIHNSIVAKNTASNTTYHDVNGSLAGTGGSSHNIIGQIGNSGLTDGVSGNKVGTLTVFKDPLLAPLGDYGGRTKTHALLAGSIALDAGKGSLTDLYDQRGYDREFDLPTSNGIDGYRDIGAYEAGVGTTLIVRSDGDRNNSISSSATTDALRLREALALSAALAGKETILFDSSVWDSDILLSLGSLQIASDVDISGPSASRLTVKGSGDAVFELDGVTSTISGIKITHGFGSDAGGGINAVDSVLVLDSVIVAENYSSGAGAGINVLGGSLTIINSTISENEAENAGAIYAENADVAIISSSIWGNVGSLAIGAIDFYGGDDLLIVNSTISGNEGLDVGAIRMDGAGVGTIVGSTIYNNSAGVSGVTGGVLIQGTMVVTFHNTILAGNVVGSTASDIYVSGSAGVADSSSYNFMGYDPSDYFDTVLGAGNIRGTVTARDARLAPLADNGGPTKTHVPYYDSDVIDAGDDTIAALWSDYDQRGEDRNEDNDWGVGAGVDIGAVELAISEYYS